MVAAHLTCNIWSSTSFSDKGQEVYACQPYFQGLVLRGQHAEALSASHCGEHSWHCCSRSMVSFQYFPAGRVYIRQPLPVCV